MFVKLKTMVEMLMIESNKSSKTEIEKNHIETPASPWCELLVNTEISMSPSVPSSVDSNTKVHVKNVSKDKLWGFSGFQKRTLSGLSFRSDAGPLLSRYRQTRFSSRRVRKRVVFKHGDCNVVQGNVAKRRRRYLQDIFTTLVDAQWRWTLLVFSMNFMLSWLGFAIVWWVIVYSHGDLETRNYSTNKTFTPCVEDIHGFTSCFLFSVETQHTIGYGSKHTTEECPEAIFVMCIQSMTGVILQAFMVGIVFAKLSRPKKRTQTLLFSRNAVICQRDGQPCLMFRVGDMRKSHIIEAHVRAQMIKRKVTREGELLPFFQTELKVGGDGEEDKIFFIWPTTIVHKIDQNSPLYHLSASDMLRERFEIIVMLEGVIESTGMTTQARSSYLPAEILWGHRFEHIITFRKETGEYEVNYTLFNNTYEVDTPLCSAAQLDELQALQRAKGERMSSSTFPAYRDNSSSSLTTSSGSSLASSAGGLHMHASTPPTPIPVTITGPDDSSRRESINGRVDLKLATFYTPEEECTELDDDNILPRSVDDYSCDQEDYNKVLQDINSSLKNCQRPSSVSLKSGPKMQTVENAKANFSSRRCDSRPNMVHIPSLPAISSAVDCQTLTGSTGALKKSASKVTLDSRHTRFAESPPKTIQDRNIINMSRLEVNTCDERNSKPLIYRVDNDEDTDDAIELTKMNRLLRISPPPLLPPPRPETSDTKPNNHYPMNASPEEQV